MAGILADARWFGPHGIGRFAHQVLKRIQTHARLTQGPKPLSLLDPLWMSYQIASQRPSVFYTPGFNVPALCGVPLVITIHDLTHLQVPDLATARRRLYYRFLLRPAARRAFRVLTVSQYSRVRILQWSGLDEDQVVSVGNGVGSEFCPEGNQYRPGYEYVLYVGGARPHKNLGRLIQAFGLLRNRDLHLVITGSSNLELWNHAQESGLVKRVHFLNGVDEQSLPALYRGARLLAIPSLAEGFGLPALEAMACGTAVLASKTCALAEVVGTAAVMVTPTSVEEICAGMEMILDHCQIPQRLRVAGLLRAKQFSWTTVAARVDRILEEAQVGV